MRQFLAGIYLILCIAHLIFELVQKSFQNGLEAVLTMGITAIGIYLAWIAMTKKFAP